MDCNEISIIALTSFQKELAGRLGLIHKTFNFPELVTDKSGTIDLKRIIRRPLTNWGGGASHSQLEERMALLLLPLLFILLQVVPLKFD